MKFFSVAAVLLLLNISQTSHAQQAMTTDELVEAWDIMTTMVIESARKMPAEHYSFTPYEPLRNFADQINHTTMSNFMFARIVNAGQPDFALLDRNTPPQSKEEVIDILIKSFAHFREGLCALEESSFTDMMAWGPVNNRREIPRLRAIMIVYSHLQREHGKTMMYLRAKDITPPQAGSFGG